MTNRGVSLFFVRLDMARKDGLIEEITDIILQAIPTLFLLIFAFIGTFGVFWLNSKKRIKEFALRIAVGSTPKSLIGLVIMESIIISTIAMIPGLVLAMSIYEFTMVHYIAIGITIIFMFVFSIVSAWYPAYIVSKINPARAFNHE